jgi:predicted ferric reductase
LNLPISLLDLCSYLGLGAAGAITVNLLLGMLMSLRYSPVKLWPRRRVNLFALHQWTAYVAMVLIVAHPLVLLSLDKPRFGWFDVLWPIHSPLQPWINVTGAVAAYLVMVVLVSSLLRTRIGRPIWRKLHYLVFPAAVMLFVHSILTDPELKDGRPDLLDGGKVFLEGAALLFVAALGVRVRLRGKGLRAKA